MSDRRNEPRRVFQRLAPTFFADWLRPLEERGVMEEVRHIGLSALLKRELPADAPTPNVFDRVETAAHQFEAWAQARRRRVYTQ